MLNPLINEVYQSIRAVYSGIISSDYYSPDTDFPNGVLAYPFECEDYSLPIEQHDLNFKYPESSRY